MNRYASAAVAVSALVGLAAVTAVAAPDTNTVARPASAEVSAPRSSAGPVGPGGVMGPGGMMGSGGMMGPGYVMGPGGMHVSNEWDYLAHMVPHHEEAVAAARHLERSQRAEMRAFGAEIVRTQSAEIEQMRTWLDQWYADASEDVVYEPMMRDLSGLTGDDLDRAFLEDMTPHHMHAVMMSQQLLQQGLVEHEEVGEFARDVRDVQRREIRQMRQWQREWFGAPGPRPVT